LLLLIIELLLGFCLLSEHNISLYHALYSIMYSHALLLHF
jgi:hypothetical protein